jgi:adenylate kinase
MGKIASGKGTQAHRILNHFGGSLYSNGDKVREASQLPTSFGRKMKEIYEAGQLAPEWVASYWMAHALASQFVDSRIVFEGVAKKPNEAQLFDEIHKLLDRPYVVFNLIIPDEVVRTRSRARQRDTVDGEAAIERRLEAYHTYTERSIEFFRAQGKLVDINGEATQDEVTEQIFTCLRT